MAFPPFTIRTQEGEKVGERLTLTRAQRFAIYETLDRRVSLEIVDGSGTVVGSTSLPGYDERGRSGS